MVASSTRLADAPATWWSNAWPVLLALAIALLAAWIVYRLQRREEREGVLAALSAELALHDLWVGGNGYTAWSHSWWSLGSSSGVEDWHKIVYKLSTVATDNAIQVGPSLFINQGLVATLVQYRQRASQFNQLIDDVAAFRASPQLWLPSKELGSLRTQLETLVAMVHLSGIADRSVYPYGANAAFHAVDDALRVERTQGRMRRWAWFWLSLTARA
jgi:hypothetical protein